MDNCRCFVCQKYLSGEEQKKSEKEAIFRPFCKEHETVVGFVNSLYSCQRRAGYLSGSTINLDLEAPLTDEQVGEIREEISAYAELLSTNIDLLFATLERASENGPEADRISRFRQDQ